MELTPRTSPDTSGADPRRRSPWAYMVLVAVLVGLGVVVYQGLTSASLYFYNADEAVAKQAALGTRRFRLQGTVLAGSLAPTENGVDFTVAFDGVDVDVHHVGDPPELFQPGIPVVVEGRWDASGAYFNSDTIRVKHSEQYKAANPGRLTDAERGSTTTTAAPAATGAP